jgi:pimeloyl-ACP methyl ester carboxylesterase
VQLPFHLPARPAHRRVRAAYRGRRLFARGVAQFSASGYGSIEAEDRLAIVHQPVLVLAGRFDRTCSVEAAECVTRGIAGAEPVVFGHSGHMTFAEENERYADAAHAFLRRHRVGGQSVGATPGPAA